VVALPAHPTKGFQRPLQVFTKLPPSSIISASTTPYSFGISPHCYNPSFTPFYGKVALRLASWLVGEEGHHRAGTEV